MCFQTVLFPTIMRQVPCKPAWSGLRIGRAWHSLQGGTECLSTHSVTQQASTQIIAPPPLSIPLSLHSSKMLSCKVTASRPLQALRTESSRPALAARPPPRLHPRRPALSCPRAAAGVSRETLGEGGACLGRAARSTPLCAGYLVAPDAPRGHCWPTLPKAGPARPVEGAGEPKALSKAGLVGLGVSSSLWDSSTPPAPTLILDFCPLQPCRRSRWWTRPRQRSRAPSRRAGVQQQQQLVVT